MKLHQFFILFHLILWYFFTSIPISFANTNSKGERQAIIEQLKNLSLEELIEVETFNPEAGLAGRKVQKLTETAAALFVITQEDIRRAGITHLAEALRMGPGIQVAKINAHEWVISARGLNETNASKLLVMIDGRTVYSPLRSEVIWHLQDLLIEDVERIEIVRGPGASLWGANAVNGIINIITKSTEDTQGNLASLHLGKGEEKSIISLRHGGPLKNNGHYRIYGKFYQHDNFKNSQGQEQSDKWEMKQAGFRVDWENSQDDTLTLQGDIFDGLTQDITTIFTPVFQTRIVQREKKGFNLLARWQQNLTDGDMILQGYYDVIQQDRGNYEYFRGIYDLDFQHRWQRNERHEWIWGLGFRYIHDDIDGSSNTTYTPSKRQDRLFSAFIQNEFKIPLNASLEEDKQELRLIVGSKFEHNDYTGFEFQPTARLLWNLNDRHNLWTAISRAVRTPSRAESDIRLNVGSPQLQMLIQGNPNLQSETLLSYELGYRFNVTNQFLLDLSLFYNEYDKLRTLEMVNFRPFPPPPLLALQMGNQMYGEIYGLELATHWQVKDNWKLITTYSYLDTQLHLQATSRDGNNSESIENNSPHHQATIRSLLTLPHQIEFDTALYYVDNLSNQNVAHYTRFDVRLGWQPWDNLNLSLGVRNILDKQHHEFSGEDRTETNSEVPRTFYLQLKYQTDNW
jgi:iron complex outermembrane recepter protein